MAYRFLLEVPESVAEAASMAVERAGDTQVLVIRPSHGLGVDDPYLDMTVAAHSLRVVDSLFDWYEAIGEPTLADAILDRLVHNAYKLALKGDSMRKSRSISKSKDTKG